MSSLAPSADSDPVVAAAAAADALLDGPVLSFDAARTGGNNRVYRAETADGVYAVKFYPSQPAPAHDRLNAEFSACEFLAGQNEPAAPKPIVRESAAGIGIYEWIDGDALVAPGGAEIDAALGFAGRLRQYSRSTSALPLGPAAEACLSGHELAAQVRRRIDRLLDVGAANAELVDFLHGRVAPFFVDAEVRARQGYAEARLSFDDNIPAAARTLSQSDFGFHNALMRQDRTVVFIDFEYFGWDDPVRLVADFMLHPGMSLSANNRQQFNKGAHDLFGNSIDGDSDFPLRLDLLYPLVGARWSTIILNEFLPERWARRAFANPGLDQKTAQHRQLEKARQMIARAEASLEGFTDGK